MNIKGHDQVIKVNKNFFTLPVEAQASRLQEAEDQLNISDVAIEKDVWVCWILKQLFQLPVKMAFKGGTSLSRIFNLIERYSEDVDVTIDYQNFIDTLDLQNTSKSQLKKISVQLKLQLKNYVKTIALPFLKERLTRLLPNEGIEITLSDSGEELRFYYPSVLNHDVGYLRDHVLIEFGIRNSTEPCEKHTISPLLLQAADNDDLSLPEADIDVLSPIRTFWEKATLIHVECNRGRLSESPDRLSRHWYDLTKLATSWVFESAMQGKSVFESVIEHKKAFYNASYAKYDDCLHGRFRLIPDEVALLSLESDFNKMKQAGMFSGEPPNFDEIVSRLKELENQINLEV